MAKTRAAPSRSPEARLAPARVLRSTSTAGKIEVTIGDRRETLGAGDCVFLPRGIPHGLLNPGPEPAQFLMLVHPPGLEYFFEEMARLNSKGEPSQEALRELAARYF